MTVPSALTLLVICNRPSDFREHITMRKHVVRPGQPRAVSPFCGLYDSLPAARSDVPPGATHLPRCAGDDPVIIESWMLL